MSETKVSEFVAGLERGEVRATKCGKCGTLHFPPRGDCRVCLSSKVEWVLISGECELLTFSKVHYAPVALKEHAPYVLAVARLKEGVKVFAPVSGDVDVEGLRPGLRMILVPVQRAGRVSYELRLSGQ